jgi:hypothetical protein
MQLLTERRLHRLLLKELESFSMNIRYSSRDGLSSSRELIALGINVIHNLYCDIYMKFCLLWIQRDPVNIMAFNTIFGEIKKEYMLQFPPIC